MEPLMALQHAHEAAAWSARGARLLHNATREGILAMVRETPGILQTELARRAGCGRATVRHHLAALGRVGLVRVFSNDQRSAAFPATVHPGNHAAVAALQRGRTTHLVMAVLANPGTSQRELTSSLGMSRKLLRKYIDRLAPYALIREAEEGRYVTYYPTPALAPLVQGLAGRLAGVPGELAETNADGSTPTLAGDLATVVRHLAPEPLDSDDGIGVTHALRGALELPLLRRPSY